MSFEVTFFRNRTSDKTVRILEADGATPVVLTPLDVVRFKIFRRDQSLPIIDIDSAQPTANGSSVTVDQLDPASATVRIAQGDLLALDPGVYEAEIDVVDESDSLPPHAIKLAEAGLVYVHSSGGGETGLT